MRRIEADVDRLALLAHYLIYRAERGQFGSTKLNKALWFADIDMYRRSGHTLTGAQSYQKAQHGPTPVGIVVALRRLHAAGDLTIEWVPTSAGPRREFRAIVKPNLESLSACEIEVLDRIILFVKDKSARELSDSTHTPLWEEVEMGGSIPVGASAVRPVAPTVAEIAWACAD